MEREKTAKNGIFPPIFADNDVERIGRDDAQD